ncbi:hypothetical protein BH23PAT2_BH23PAT2_02420 [soil metagenome]
MSEKNTQQQSPGSRPPRSPWRLIIAIGLVLFGLYLVGSAVLTIMGQS